MKRVNNYNGNNYSFRALIKEECPECGKTYYNGGWHALQYNGAYHKGVDRCPCCGTKLVQCEECGEWYALSNITLAENGRYICDDCLESYYYYSWAMERYIAEADAVWFDRVDDYVTHGWLDANYYYCDRCGNWVTYEEWNVEQDCCVDCAYYEEPCHCQNVAPYHDKPDGQRYWTIEGQVSAEDFEGVGVELEIDKDWCDSWEEEEATEAIMDTLGRHHVYFNEDCSLSAGGFEIISQAHTIEAFRQLNWQEVMAICKQYGYECNWKTGLHVHLSRGLFGDTLEEQEDTINKVLAFYGIFRDEIADKAGRYVCGYSKAVINLTEEEKKPEAIKDAVKRKKCQLDRYLSVNLTNAHTIEFRQGAGTLDINQFNNWVEFTYRMVQRARSINWENVADWDAWELD